MINNDNVAHKVTFPRPAEGGRAAAAANLVSTVFSPALVVFYAVLLCSYSIEHSSKLLWTSFFVLLFVLAPTAYIFYLMGRGKVTDFHISVREERIRPLSVIFIYSVFLLMFYSFVGGPGALVTLGYSCLALTGLWILVSLCWKISGHCAAMGALGAMVFAHPHEKPGLRSPALGPAGYVVESEARVPQFCPDSRGRGHGCGGFLVFPFLIPGVGRY